MTPAAECMSIFKVFTEHPKTVRHGENRFIVTRGALSNQVISTINPEQNFVSLSNVHVADLEELKLNLISFGCFVTLDLFQTACLGKRSDIF